MSKEEITALTAAGNDSDGSADMSADLHAFYVRKVYGVDLMTIAVAGNITGICAAQVMPVDFIQKQSEVLNDNFSVKALKTGVLVNKDIINCVADGIEKYNMGKVVIDPVIITKHGDSLLDNDAYQTLSNRLLPLADIITSSYYEQKKLIELSLDSETEILAGAKKLQALGAKNVLIKGKHTGDSSDVVDILLTEDGQIHRFSEPYYKTGRANDTGDTLSAVIAAGLAKGTSLIEAVGIAKDFTYEATSHPIIVGPKQGPINHRVAGDNPN